MTGQHTIYLVDDDDDDRFIIREAVEGVLEQVSFSEYSNGIDFLKQLEQPGLDLDSVLILMDINMPRMNGIEVIAALRSLPNCQGLPILVLSTAASPEVIKQAIESGAAQFFIKPSSLADLRILADEIKSYLHHRG
ncbi:response regulator [Dyadobacter tibetensis]|uniref:response regulator n=1 Tax=Dyadobacter tibetensis TaxID=1211851 RepID=UPI00047126E6|nr:response regulator transcription factor [Dyadobacter tibetensis]